MVLAVQVRLLRARDDKVPLQYVALERVRVDIGGGVLQIFLNGIFPSKPAIVSESGKVSPLFSTTL